jgi:LuxR family maltose regulon positive regulatory protein
MGGDPSPARLAMTLSPNAAAVPLRPHAERDWAVVEIRPDGSLGPANLVVAAGPRDAARLARDTRALPRRVPDSGALDVRLGLALAGAGRLVEARRAFTRALDLSPDTVARADCAGHLALVEACRGHLHLASERAATALADSRDSAPGFASAHLALAWVDADHDLHHGASRHLALAASQAGDDLWTGTVHTLLEARLLLSSRPDSAVRLLSCAADDPYRAPSRAAGGWTAAAVTVARAEALLALGEPHRALAVLTPLPTAAATDAGVTVAAARLDIGDARGAEAVLSSLAERLEAAGLATQVHAWLLEARVAEARGRSARAGTLVDRALRCSSAEDLRAPVRHHWAWLRLRVDHDRELARFHREFLDGFRDVPATGRQDRLALVPAPRTDAVMGAHLTRREVEVLELLSRMYSTDEIADALYVSANTVKTHLKGIYGKLCVNRRADAVRRGRQLGLC